MKFDYFYLLSVNEGFFPLLFEGYFVDSTNRIIFISRKMKSIFILKQKGVCFNDALPMFCVNIFRSN